MTSKDLKLLAGEMVLESDYSDSAKKQLFNFIAEEANEIQIKSLMIDGKMTKIAEDAVQIIDKRFENMVENGMVEILEDTLTFMGIARETLCEYLETLGHPEEALDEMTNFVLKEATDYQVMSMLMDKGLPEEDQNLEEEYNLYEAFNQSAGTNFVPLTEFEVSSSQLDILTEAAPKETPRMKALKGQVDKNIAIFQKWAKTKGPKADARKAQIQGTLRTLKGEISKEKAKIVHAAGAGAGAAGMSAAVKKKQAGGVVKSFTAGQLARGAVIKGKAGAVKGYQKGKELAKKGAVAAAPLAAKGKAAAVKGYQKGKDVAGKGAAMLKQKAIAAKGKLSQLAAKLPSATSIAAKAKLFATSGVGMALGGTALAALLAYGASKIYKSYFSKAAKACSGQGDKAGCMAKYKASAVKAQIADLSKSASACSKSKNPEKCKASIIAKINKLKSKIA